MLVEVCANSLQSALNAEKAGADRIELCSELAVGGITPSYGLLKAVIEKISIPVRVLIRPRSGDFTYSYDEFEIMKKNISLCVEMGFNGIVSGVLNKDATLDSYRTKALVETSDQLQFTFHRAFDWVQHPKEVLEQLENLGVNTILTSGQKTSAFEGLNLLEELLRQSSKCTIMPGGGISINTIGHFKERGFKAVHLSGSKFIRTLDDLPKVSMNSASFLRDDAIATSDLETIRSIVQAVK